MGSRGASSGRIKSKSIKTHGVIAVKKTNSYKLGTNSKKLSEENQKRLKRASRHRLRVERSLRERREKLKQGKLIDKRGQFEQKRYSQTRYARLMDKLWRDGRDDKKAYERFKFLKEKNKKIRPKTYNEY
jgi:hypothetical protein